MTQQTQSPRNLCAHCPGMEEAEPPECQVCLQPYDAVSVIPRVLTCGHTTCEACLKQLPNPFPSTLRCTVCTLLTKIPNSISVLPKNLDLLHFSSILQPRRRDRGEKVKSSLSPLENGKIQSVKFPANANSWSYEFFCKWKRWIIPEECIISIEKSGSSEVGAVASGEVFKSFESDHAMGFVSREKENVGLFKIGILVKDEEDPRLFIPSHESRILTILYEMNEEDRHKLSIMLNISHRICHVGKAYGFWLNEDDDCVYVVWQRFSLSDFPKFVLDGEDESLSRDELSGLCMLGMEMCEIMMRLHSEGLVIGCLSVSSFGFDDFDRISMNLSEVLNSSMRVSMMVKRVRKDSQLDLKNTLLDENIVFISPEMLLLFIHDGLPDRVWGKPRYEALHASDLWSIASLLVWLILGNFFTQEMEAFLQYVVVNVTRDEKGCDYSGLYTSWMEKITQLLQRRLGSNCGSLCEILCKCLRLDPRNRPVVTQLWKCLREVIVKPRFDIFPGLRQKEKEEHSRNCVLVGEICGIVKEIDERSTHDAAEGLPVGRFKCVELRGHIDCVTGLAVGGGFLFSSSFDKIVHVWSLQDFTHIHSFEGHEHRVMAVVFTGGEHPLCISGDSEGIIFIWRADLPFSALPMAKLFEKKDWRFSGIHSMAVYGRECLYTGSGDKLVKAWSLQDHTLMCEMSGHKSVVSSLMVSNGVLFSGSWDGTVRLWSLSDHSPLTVLGEGKFGNVVSVFSLSAHRNLLFAGHENGAVKIWHNDALLKSTETHKGAVFSVTTNGKWLFSGGWDKTIHVQEISEDGNGINVTSVGSIPCSSTITSLVYCDGKLFVAQADKIIKVYYHGV